MDRINELMEKVYELQGLLTLMKESPAGAANLTGLIRRKADLIANLARALEESRTAAPDPAPAPLTAPVCEPDPEPVPAAPVAPETSAHSQTSLLPSLLRLSLNDRFRFTRSLFGGSRADLDSFLRAIASLDSLHDVESYCYSELGWDRETPEVADFMELIRLSGIWAN